MALFFNLHFILKSKQWQKALSNSGIVEMLFKWEKCLSNIFYYRWILYYFCNEVTCKEVAGLTILLWKLCNTNSPWVSAVVQLVKWRNVANMLVYMHCSRYLWLWNCLKYSMQWFSLLFKSDTDLEPKYLKVEN